MKKFLAWHGCPRCIRGSGFGRRSRCASLHQGAPPMIAAIYDWSGFYIGANGGWGSSRKCWDLTTAAGVRSSVAEGCHDATGGIAGGQIGYRWQAGTWVFGLEAQGNWADLKGRNASLAIPGRLHQRLEDRCLRPVHRPGRLRLRTTSCSTSRAARP